MLNESHLSPRNDTIDNSRKPANTQANDYYRAIDKHVEHNAFIAIDRQLSETTPPENKLLTGMVIAVKDNIHVAGLTNTAGTALLRNFVPQRNATVIDLLKAAGAQIIGKNNMHELAYGITSDNAVFGSVLNATNSSYMAGGSSGGTAVAVALNMASAGLGTDTGGSVRIPAALNGLVGFRPSTGRYPNSGITLVSNTRDTAGPITHTVADAKLMDRVLADNFEPSDTVDIRGLRLGVPRAYFYEHLDADVAAVMESTLQRLAAAGAILIEADLNNVPELNEKISFPVVLHETSQLLPQYLQMYLPGNTAAQLIDKIVSPDVKQIVGDALSGAIAKDVYMDARIIQRPLLQQAYRDYFSRHNVQAIIFPTTPLPARLLTDKMDTVELNGEEVPTFATYIRNTDPASNAGLPGISLPAGTSAEGLPIGVELDGPAGDDNRLLEIAAAVERVLAST